MSSHLPTVQNARLSWREDGLPFSEDYGDIYFSSAGAAAESAHVFLDGNDLARRWRALRPGARFVIVELGFGSGLNVLGAWRLWERCAPPAATLQILSCELHPLTGSDLGRLHALWPDPDGKAAVLRELYPEQGAGQHRRVLAGAPRPVLLDLLYGAADYSLHGLLAREGPCVDAWFLDGFAPGRNPALWSAELFDSVAALSRPGATLATYSVAGQVRAGLTAAGFDLEKRPGHGHKRHMLRGRLGEARARDNAAWRPAALPWFTLPRPPRAASALVLGAGLAGCATAHALARRGLAVQVLERAGVAAAASGNPRGAVYLKLGADPHPGTLFQRQAWLFALAHYRRLAAEHDFGWRPCGLLQLAWNTSELERRRGLLDKAIYGDALLRAVDTEQAAALSGLPLRLGGLYLPQAADLDPTALCRAWLREPGIVLREGSTVASLQREDGLWIARDAADRELGRAEAVVLAGALDLLDLPCCAHYPLQAVRGQLSYFEAGPHSAALRCIVCTAGYVLPALQGRHVVGASFIPGSRDTALWERDHARNLALAEDIDPGLGADFRPQPMAGRAALRCVSPDHLPLVGPVEDHARTLEDYAFLRRNGRLRRGPPLSCLPGLYVNAGHGSHGLSNAPLAADYLASLIAGDLLPLAQDQLERLHPVRFGIRALKRRER